MMHDGSGIRKLPQGGSAPRPPGFSALGASGRVGCSSDKKGRLARSGLCRMATDGRSGRFPASPYPPAGSIHNSRAHAPREDIESIEPQKPTETA